MYILVAYCHNDDVDYHILLETMKDMIDEEEDTEILGEGTLEAMRLLRYKEAQRCNI